MRFGLAEGVDLGICVWDTQLCLSVLIVFCLSFGCVSSSVLPRLVFGCHQGPGVRAEGLAQDFVGFSKKPRLVMIC